MTRTVLAEDNRDITRGHAEILMGQIENCLIDSHITYDEIERIGVARGPGSFAGIRVGMAAAKGLGLALNIPVAGVSCLDACETYALEKGAEMPLLSVLDAKRDQFYCKLSQTQSNSGWLAGADDLSFEGASGISSIAGSGAREAADILGIRASIAHENAAIPIHVYATLAAQLPEDLVEAEPLYLRSADAKPQSGFALERAPG